MYDFYYTQSKIEKIKPVLEVRKLMFQYYAKNSDDDDIN